MAQEMEDLAFAIRMRNLVERIVRDVVEQVRPKYRYATVQAIRPLDPDSGLPVEKASVTFNGETSAVLVSLTGVVPSALGQIVRVEGIGADRYITGVVGGAVHNGVKFGTVSSLTGAKPNVIWEGDTAASGPYSLTGAASTLTANDKVVGIPVPGYDLLIVKVIQN